MEKTRTLKNEVELVKIMSKEEYTLYQDQNIPDGLFHIETPSGKWFHTSDGVSEFLYGQIFDKGINLQISKKESRVFMFKHENWWVGLEGENKFFQIEMFNNATVIKHSSGENFKILLPDRESYWVSPDQKDSFLNVVVHELCLIINTRENVWQVFDLKTKKWIENRGRILFARVSVLDNTKLRIQNTSGREENIFVFSTLE